MLKTKMFSKIVLIVYCILLGIEFNEAEKYKACSIYSPSCPEISVCSQRNIHEEAGDCKCTGNNEFNPAYHNDSDYCIPSPVMQPTIAAAGGSSGNLDKTASAISQNQPPNSHHIVGGILIPIFLVLIILGVTYGVKRMHVIKRIRDMMAARRSRPFYEDVMMSNDNDDPPLI